MFAISMFNVLRSVQFGSVFCIYLFFVFFFYVIVVAFIQAIHSFIYLFRYYFLSERSFELMYASAQMYVIRVFSAFCILHFVYYFSIVIYGSDYRVMIPIANEICHKFFEWSNRMAPNTSKRNFFFFGHIFNAQSILVCWSSSYMFCVAQFINYLTGIYSRWCNIAANTECWVLNTHVQRALNINQFIFDFLSIFALNSHYEIGILEPTGRLIIITFCKRVNMHTPKTGGSLWIEMQLRCDWLIYYLNHNL